MMKAQRTKSQIAYARQRENDLLARHIIYIWDVFNANPYPKDIFTGKTEEGMRGIAGRISWENSCLLMMMHISTFDARQMSDIIRKRR